MVWFQTRKGRGYGKYDNPSHGSPHQTDSSLFWETKKPFMDKYGVTFANYGGSTPASAGRSLRCSCSCRLIVLVETTTRVLFWVANNAAGTRYAKLFPTPVPASTSRCSRLTSARATAIAIACWRLIGFYRKPDYVVKADKAFLVTFFGAVVMLLGFATGIRRNKPETFSVVEPLHNTCCHCIFLNN